MNGTTQTMKTKMKPEEKLSSALAQVESIFNLIKGNQYEQYLESYLIPLKVELKRQLTNLSHPSKINE